MTTADEKNNEDQPPIVREELHPDLEDWMASEKAAQLANEDQPSIVWEGLHPALEDWMAPEKAAQLAFEGLDDGIHQSEFFRCETYSGNTTGTTFFHPSYTKRPQPLPDFGDKSHTSPFGGGTPMRNVVISKGDVDFESMRNLMEGIQRDLAKEKRYFSRLAEGGKA